MSVRSDLRAYVDRGGSLDALAETITEALDGDGTATAEALLAYLAGNRTLLSAVLDELRHRLEDAAKELREKEEAKAKLVALRGSESFTKEEIQAIRRKAFAYCKREGSNGKKLGVDRFARRVFGLNDREIGAVLPIRSFTRFFSGTSELRDYIGAVARLVANETAPPSPAAIIRAAFDDMFEDPAVSSQHEKQPRILGSYAVAYGPTQVEGALFVDDNGVARTCDLTDGRIHEGVEFQIGAQHMLVMQQIAVRHVKRIFLTQNFRIGQDVTVRRDGHVQMTTAFVIDVGFSGSRRKLGAAIFSQGNDPEIEADPSRIAPEFFEHHIRRLKRVSDVSDKD